MAPEKEDVSLINIFGSGSVLRSSFRLFRLRGIDICKEPDEEGSADRAALRDTTLWRSCGLKKLESPVFAGHVGMTPLKHHSTGGFFIWESPSWAPWSTGVDQKVR